ncbi:hypothetical protein [Mucilaginibacter sp.]
MFIVWRGYGFLVPLIALVVVAVVHLLFNALFSTVQPWGICLGLAAAAAALWFTGIRLNSPLKNRTVVDKATGQEFLITPSHSFFFIKIQYWAYIAAAVAIILFISLLTHPARV